MPLGEPTCRGPQKCAHAPHIGDCDAENLCGCLRTLSRSVPEGSPTGWRVSYPLFSRPRYTGVERRPAVLKVGRRQDAPSGFSATSSSATIPELPRTVSWGRGNVL